jgi:hypothetical protein
MIQVIHGLAIREQESKFAEPISTSAVESKLQYGKKWLK